VIFLSLKLVALSSFAEWKAMVFSLYSPSGKALLFRKAPQNSGGSAAPSSPFDFGMIGQ
jgi:hypothetical protein